MTDPIAEERGEDFLLIRGQIRKLNEFRSTEADAGQAAGAVRLKLAGNHPPITTMITPRLARSLADALNAAAQGAEEYKA